MLIMKKQQITVIINALSLYESQCAIAVIWGERRLHTGQVVHHRDTETIIHPHPTKTLESPINLPACL